jgi:hypothetical protein
MMYSHYITCTHHIIIVNMSYWITHVHYHWCYVLVRMWRCSSYHDTKRCVHWYEFSCSHCLREWWMIHSHTSSLTTYPLVIIHDRWDMFVDKSCADIHFITLWLNWSHVPHIWKLLRMKLFKWVVLFLRLECNVVAAHVEGPKGSLTVGSNENMIVTTLSPAYTHVIKMHAFIIVSLDIITHLYCTSLFFYSQWCFKWSFMTESVMFSLHTSCSLTHVTRFDSSLTSFVVSSLQ